MINKLSFSLIMLLTVSICLSGQIVINEIFPQSNKIEVKNLGSAIVDISNLYLCTFPSYGQFSTFSFDCGSVNLAAGQLATVTVAWSLNANNGELALYIDNNFASSSSIRDYVEWGSSGHGRSSVAVGAGIWSNGSFVGPFGSSSSLEYDGSGNSPGDWMEQVNNTLCNENGGNPPCDITSSGLTNISCNENGTFSDPIDDIVNFDLNPSGDNLGATYNIQVSTGSVSPTSANYGASQSFQLQAGSAGGGDITITIIDSEDASCTAQILLADPGSCSMACAITSSGLANITCNDSGTNSDPIDDFVSFDLDPSGGNLGATYEIQVSTGSVSPTSANYGAAQSFQLQAGSAGGGDITITIADLDSDSFSCSFLILLLADPGSCSMACSITSSGLTNISCNDNGTSSDPIDDFVSFDLDPSGGNLGATYDIQVSTGSVSPTSANYGSSQSFQLQAGSAGGGDITITIIDSEDTTCKAQAILADPGSCSIVSAVNDENIKQAINVYPNPASSYFTLELANPALNNLNYIQLLDISGKILIKQKYSGSALQRMDIHSLNDGIYIVQMRIDDRWYYLKLFIWE